MLQIQSFCLFKDKIIIRRWKSANQKGFSKGIFIIFGVGTLHLERIHDVEFQPQITVLPSKCPSIQSSIVNQKENYGSFGKEIGLRPLLQLSMDLWIRPVFGPPLCGVQFEVSIEYVFCHDPSWKSQTYTTFDVHMVMCLGDVFPDTNLYRPNWINDPCDNRAVGKLLLW